MKTKIFALTFSFLVFFANAQTKGSISISKSKDKISYKQFIAPVALITTGALMVNTALNDDLQKNANNFFGEDTEKLFEDCTFKTTQCILLIKPSTY